ncbi:MAG: NAD(P)H-hydrate dehydratase [Nitrospirae bacterium]|nr:NAD(P)H-hydrate dehydratase [Nitrospirota bacterium]
MKVVTSEQMRRIDDMAIRKLGIPGLKLMENAGAGVISAVERRWGTVRGRKIVVICGKGNNGGDGFVVARLAKSRGARVRVRLLADAPEIRGDALVNLKRWKKAGGAVERAPLTDADLADADFIVDAIFGTGLSQPLADRFASAVDAINVSDRPVVSIDIPSGVNGTTGEIMGCAVRADLTVALGLPKCGHVLFPGAEQTGSVEVVDIGLPAEALASEPSSIEMTTGAEMRKLFKKRPEGSHKGDYGHLLLVGGSRSKVGAIAMAARAAIRSGVGLVTAGVPESAELGFHTLVLEAMSVALPEMGGELCRESAVAALEASRGKDAVALGPGLGWSEETTAFSREFVASLQSPLVVDADGLNALSDRPDILERRKASTVLTPHPGEMARLSHSTTQEVQANRIESAVGFARKHSVVVLLKGARTVVATPEGVAHINPTGNPGMATGGTGDVLTGVIGSLLAQGFSALDSARAGAYLHGWAGDVAAESKGQIALVAMDLVEFLPTVFKEIETSRAPYAPLRGRRNERP